MSLEEARFSSNMTKLVFMDYMLTGGMFVQNCCS